jgi:glycosyltransferase involved in cell wall biosynthesis
VPQSAPRLVFDLTTSSRWHGPAVGIVRVQRELGRHAPDAVPGAVDYALYDRRRGAFLRLKPEIAAEILCGRLVVHFPGPGATSAPPRSERARWAVLHPKRFVRARLRRSDDDEPAPRVDFDEAVDGVLELGPSDVLLTCGADWAGRDVPGIGAAKERDGFGYVLVCYDVIARRHPEFWPPGVAESVVRYYAEATPVADLVMCISRATAQELTELCEELDIVPPRLGIFRLGDETTAAAATALPLALRGSRFVLSVGSLEPRKNHRILYDAWDALCREPAFPPDVKLVFVAATRWMTDDLEGDLERNPFARERIVVLDRASDEALRSLYEACLFTVYPSLHEGWGMPVAESLSHGKVCVASNRGSMPEISTAIPLLDPRDVDGWRNAIRHLVVDAGARERLEQTIRAEYRPTSWAASARSFFSTVFAELGV